MTGPDYPDWHQPVTDVMLQTTVFSGTIAAATSGAPLDVSRYESVVVFTQVSYLVADLTFDQAGSQLVQELKIPGGGYPLVCVGPWLTLTNSTAGVANVTVIGTNRKLDPSLVNVGTNIGWRGHTTSTAMVAGNTYGLLTEVGALPYGLCSLWVQITNATTTLGILEVVTVDNHVVELWDTNLASPSSVTIGRSGQALVAIPAGTNGLQFECTAAGTSDVRAALVSAN